MTNIQSILEKMTLKDKIAFCSGANFWQTKAMPQYGIPAIALNDGPHGLRKQERGDGADMLGINESLPATCFPTAAITAASWDEELLGRIGSAIGEEALAQQVAVVLGPGVNMKRNPLCGRNFEYFSEDPFLAGKLAAAFIRGVEQHGVGTSLKHFACNNQEKDRFSSDSVMDERTLRELYLRGFEIAVREGHPATLMSAYNKINGTHCSDNRKLLTEILREDWGFDDMVVTDWGGMSDRVAAFSAGCDLSMPGGSDYMEQDCAEAVQNGTLDEKDIDRSVERILRQVFRASAALKDAPGFDAAAHHALAAEAAASSAVLLKNEGGILPLKEGQPVVLIGAMARDMRYQGAGSSHINPTMLTHPADAMPTIPWAAGCDAQGNTTDALLSEAARAAGAAEVAIVFAGLPGRYESEGFDRDSMDMPQGHLRMIEAVSAANPNTVVVLLSGCAVACPWADSVKAILYMGLPGQAGGEAARRLLYGEVNPSGKLAESWPLCYEDCPSAPYYAKTKDALYLEGIYTGYRYYDKAGVAVRWPFGYGLSYTSFTYSDMVVENRRVSVTLSNTGEAAGAEVVQLFIHPPQDGIHRPVRELKGFTKVFLAPGESARVHFDLDDRSFAVWQDGWRVPAGLYTVAIGDLQEDMRIAGERLIVPKQQAGSWYEHCEGRPDQADLERAMGRPYTPHTPKKGAFTMDNSGNEMKGHSLVMKIMFKAVESTVAKGFGGKKDYDNPDFRMMINASAGAPLRSMQISGGMKGGVFKGLLDMANGHFFRGVYRMLRGG